MRKHVLAAATLVLFTTGNLFAQRTCASYQLLQDQMRDDPDFARKVREREKSFGNYLRQSNKQNGKPAAITIPVVVHVVYNTAEENIPDAQIQSQIDVLNQDFTATNSDYKNYDAGYGAVKGDADIRFCLVQTRRVATTRKQFPYSTNGGVKKTQQGGDDAIDPEHTLNIWVCNLGQNLLGYAQFPGGPVNTFGIVIYYKAFGRGAQFNLLSAYNLGRTATHEVGHCLGLRHIWGDATCGNDFVDDTPLHNAPNFGCPGEGHLSTCTGTPLEMWMNYMDYTDDRCMYFFSDGQVSRANFFIDTDAQLQSIIGSSCTSIPVTTASIVPGNAAQVSSRMPVGGLALYPSLTNGTVNMELNASKSGLALVNIYNEAGALVMKQQIAVTEGMNTKTFDISRLQNGVYILQFTGDNTYAIKKLVVRH